MMRRIRTFLIACMILASDLAGAEETGEVRRCGFLDRNGQVGGSSRVPFFNSNGGDVHG